MAVETIKTRTARILLENGTDSKGNLKTVSVSVGSLSPVRWDADKVLAIAGGLEPIFSKTMHVLEGTATSTIATA